MAIASRIDTELPQKDEWLSKLQDVPTLPTVAMQVSDLMSSPTSSVADIARILQADQSLTAKVLRLANSSYYAVPGGVKDIQRALAFLGFNTIAQLVLGVSVFSLFRNLGDDEFSLSSFWRHALGTAICSESIAKRKGFPKTEEVFTCGLLHDIGKLVLFQVDADLMRTLLREAKAHKSSFDQTEKDHHQPGHSWIGSEMSKRWGLPETIQNVILMHHENPEPQDLPSRDAEILWFVQVANGLCVKSQIGDSGNYSGGVVKQETLDRAGLSASDLKEIEDSLHQELAKAGAFLNVITQ